MRRRLTLFSTLSVLVLALMLPATTAAASLGKIAFISGYCTGNNTVHATFKVTKYAGYHASRITLTGKAQEYTGGRWRVIDTIVTFTKHIDTSGRATFQKEFDYNPGRPGMFRLKAFGKILDGNSTIATGQIAASGYCM